MPDLKILQKSATLHEARWWEAEPGNKVHCYLCPRHCHIGEGQAGFCYIRANEGGKLYSLGMRILLRCRLILLRRSRSVILCPGRKYFRWGRLGATWAASS